MTTENKNYKCLLFAKAVKSQTKFYYFIYIFLNLVVLFLLKNHFSESSSVQLHFWTGYTVFFYRVGSE